MEKHSLFKKFVMLFVLSIILFILSNCNKKSINLNKSNNTTATIDLKATNNNTIKLNGPWEFYWNKLLYPNDFNDNISHDSLVDFPFLWNNYKLKNKTFNNYGYATFRTTIKNINKNEIYTIQVKNISTAYRLFINGKLILSNGRVANNREKMIPKSYLKSADYYANDNNLELILQVSNFYHFRGGIFDPLVFGKSDVVKKLISKHLILDTFLFSSFLMIALYNLALYLFRKSDKATLYFSILCFLISLRSIMTGQYLLVQIFPTISWELQHKIEVLTIYFSFPIFLLYFKSIYSNSIGKKFLQFIVIISIMFSIIVIVTKCSTYGYFLLYYQALLAISTLYIIYCLIRIYLKNGIRSSYTVFGIVVLLITIINDVLMANSIIDTGYFTPFGLLIFIFSQGLMISAIFSKRFSKIEKQYKKQVKIIKENLTKYSNLLNNAGQGFLSFNKDLIIDNEYSKECIRIFNYEINTMKFTNLISTDKDEKIFLKSVIDDVFKASDEYNENLYLSLLPSEIDINNKTIAIKYKVIHSSINSNKKIMVILTDITDKRKLENEMEKERKILKTVVKVYSNKKIFIECLNEFKNFYRNDLNTIIKSEIEIKDLIYNIYIKIHTFKGNFSQFNLPNIVDNLHEIETKLSEIEKLMEQGAYSKSKFISFITSINYEELLDKDVNIINKHLGEDFFNDEDLIHISKQKLIDIEEKIVSYFPFDESKHIVNELRKLRYVPIKSMLESYPYYLEKLSKRLNKKIKPVKIYGDNFLINPDIYTDFIKSLIHVFRNSVDHGIEPPDVRLKMNKDESGNIKCLIKRIKNKIIISISDDGKGIDIIKLKNYLIDNNIFSSSEIQNFSKSELISCIFNKNTTTVENTTTISGRGIGLNAVKQELEKLNGHFNIYTETNLGTKFEFIIPYKQELLSEQLNITSIMKPLIKSVNKYCKNELEKQTHKFDSKKIKKAEKVDLYELSAFINISGLLHGKFILSIEKKLVKSIVNKLFNDDINKYNEKAIFEDFLGETANIILGNCLDDFDNLVNMIRISSPVTLFSKRSTIKYPFIDCWIYNISLNKGNIKLIITSSQNKFYNN